MAYWNISIDGTFSWFYAAAILKSLKDIWENEPPNWQDTDPCGSNWEGIGCTNSRVTSM